MGKATPILGQTLPRRPLGRTGEMVRMLGLGGFHVGILAGCNQCVRRGNVRSDLDSRKSNRDRKTG
jgi:hypothetical protein